MAAIPGTLHLAGWLLALAAAPPEQAHEGGPPLIDIDHTIFIEFGFFLLLLLVLHVCVFRPFLRARAEREDRIDGERRRATEMEESAQKKIADFEARLEKAKHKGIGLRLESRQKAQAREREILERARLETHKTVEGQRAALARSADAARAKLARSAERWGKDLAGRILGREVP